MSHPSLQRILKKAGIPNLLEILTEKLTPSDLQSLLLEVYINNAAKVSLAQLKEQYQHNRFVKSASINPTKLLAFDQFAFSIAEKLNFRPIELSPLSPLGSCSAMAKVHQNKVVSTSRNVEVLADPTNILALEAAIEREKLLKEYPKDKTVIQLCASHRATRAQFIDLPNYFAHFKIFGMGTAGRDTGNFSFEIEQLEKHLHCYLNLMTTPNNIISIPVVEVSVTPIEKRIIEFTNDMLFPKLQQQFPTVSFQIEKERKNGLGYYETLCFHIKAGPKKEALFQLVDGGFTNWTQQLISSKKERYLISAIGSERTILLFHKDSYGR